MSEEDLQRYRDALGQPGSLFGAVSYYRAALRRVFGKQPQWKPVEQETQVIWGTGDRFLKPVLAEPPPKWVPKLRVDRVEGADHFVQMDAPEQVNALLLEHLGVKS